MIRKRIKIVVEVRCDQCGCWLADAHGIEEARQVAKELVKDGMAVWVRGLLICTQCNNELERILEKEVNHG